MALPFASSYIKTVASTVTRAADNLSVDAANIPAPTADYSVSADVDVLASIAGTSQLIWRVKGETTRETAGSTPAEVLKFNQVNSVDGTPPLTQQTVVSVKSSSTIELFQDGVSQGTAAPGAVTGTKVDIGIGSDTAIQQLFGHIKDFKIFAVALTPTQVAAL